MDIWNTLQQAYGIVDSFNTVGAILGPATIEFGELARDCIRQYRHQNSLKAFFKTVKMLQENNTATNAVPLKVLFPWFEGASFEDDESMQDMWAALLANASAGDGVVVRPAFLAMLRQMAPDEAVLLKHVRRLTADHEAWLEDGNTSRTRQELDRKLKMKEAQLMTALREGLPWSENTSPADFESRFNTCVSVLENQGLIRWVSEVVHISDLGRTFLSACEPPASRNHPM